MPYYDFVCSNNHSRELKMTFAEHQTLEEDEGGPFIECNVKYGDTKKPICGEKAHQVMSGNISFAMNYGAEGP